MFNHGFRALQLAPLLAYFKNFPDALGVLTYSRGHRVVDGKTEGKYTGYAPYAITKEELL